ncbi:hypothetical protein KC319_g5340, partial [Hortaea werneckii]
EDAVIVEGYAEYATWRPHLAYLRDPYGDPDMEMEIDGVGGVSILAKARVFRAGVHFPAFSFEKHAETEGFGKMAKRMKYSVIGLPHYTIWHMYEPSVDDIRHMEEMEQERQAREKEEGEKREREERIKQQFDMTEGKGQWEKDKAMLEEALKGEKAEADAKEKAGKEGAGKAKEGKAAAAVEDEASEVRPLAVEDSQPQRKQESARKDTGPGLDPVNGLQAAESVPDPASVSDGDGDDGRGDAQAAAAAEEDTINPHGNPPAAAEQYVKDRSRKAMHGLTPADRKKGQPLEKGEQGRAGRKKAGRKGKQDVAL